MKLFAIFIAILTTSVMLIVVFSGTSRSVPTRIACIGDSITENSAYPAELQDMLGASYFVKEFGVTGSTIMTDTFKPYICTAEFFRAREFLPNIVIIMLGTNDAREDHYKSIENFVGDYERLIRKVQEIESNPRILLVKPPPIFGNELYLRNVNLLEGVIPDIEQVAKAFGLTTIDVYTPLVSRPDYFWDGVHPNNQGAHIIAREICDAI